MRSKAFFDHVCLRLPTDKRALLGRIIGGVLSLSLSPGCAGPEPAARGSVVSALFDVAVVARFDPEQGQLPESMTADADGNYYFSMANTVQRLTPDGQLRLYAQVGPPGSLAAGMKFGPDGLLYVCGASFDPQQDAAAVYRVAAGGAVTRLAHLDPAGFPNDLTFDRDGNIYVTEPFLGLIYKLKPELNAEQAGPVTVWAQDRLLLGNSADPALPIHSFGADGLAFDRQEKNLYVGNFDTGAILRIPVSQGAAAAAPSVWVRDPRLRGADGLTFDARGDLYIAVNTQDQVARIDASGTVSILAAGSPLDSPSSLMLAEQGPNKKSLKIANFAVSRAFGLKPGAPSPSLAALPISSVP